MNLSQFGSKTLNLGADILTLGASGAKKAQQSANRSQMSDLDKLREQMQGQYAQEQNDITNTFDPWTANASQDLETYRNQAGQDLSQYQFDPWEKFDTSTVSKYLDPSMDAQIQVATKAVENSAANRGNLFSGETAKALQSVAQDKAKQSYQQALDTARADWEQKRNYGIQSQGQGLDLAQTQLANSQALANLGYGATQNAYNARSGARDAMNSNLANLQMAKGQLEAQNKAMPSGASQFMSSLPSWISMIKEVKKF